jgi:hypothetical protein
MAQEVGKGVGRGEILLGSVPQGQGEDLICTLKQRMVKDFQDFQNALFLVR